MRGLIPRDYWEHHIADIPRGLAAAMRPAGECAKIGLPGLGDCTPISSGRAAVVAAIKALDLPRGARIGVPLYCCPVVFEAVVKAECVPSFLDVEPETFCLSAEDLSKKRSEVEAVIAVHMFGNICDIPGLKDVVGRKPIIEDCAQALGSGVGGRGVGSLGTISFFSFQSGKYLSAGGGGALFSAVPDVRRRLAEYVAAIPGPGKMGELLHVAQVYAKSVLRDRPLYGLLGYPLWTYANEKMGLAERSNVNVAKIRRTDWALATKRLAGLDAAIRKQRAHSDFYAKALTLEPGFFCAEKPGAFYNRYRFPITFPSAAVRDYIAAFLLRDRIDSIKPFDDIVEVATRLYGYKGGCPVTEQITKRILAIPNHQTLRERDVRRIAESLNEGWKTVRRPGAARWGRVL